MSGTNYIRLSIPGKPLGKQRPRVLRNGVTYTPQETINYETLIKQLWITQNSYQPLKGPIKILVQAYFPIPKSASKKKRYDMLVGKIRPEIKPDWDNIGKIVSDALNGLAYTDDKSIVEAIVQKFYSLEPRVDIIIQTLTEEEVAE